LLLRPLIWPPNEISSLLPKTINDVFDIRTRIALTPLEGQSRTQCLMNAHVVLGPHVADRKHKCDLPRREVRLLKELFADMVEILTIRHELGQVDEEGFPQQQAPEVIWLPLLIAQLRRIVVLCMGAALEKRVLRMQEANSRRRRSWMLSREEAAVLARQHFVKTMSVFKSNSNVSLDAIPDLPASGIRPISDAELISAVRDPVSVEELQDALLGLEPTLVNRRHARQKEALKKSITMRHSIFKHVAHVDWTFDDDQLLHDIGRWDPTRAEFDDDNFALAGNFADNLVQDSNTCL